MDITCGRCSGEEGYGSSVWCLSCDLGRQHKKAKTQEWNKEEASTVIPIPPTDVMTNAGSTNLIGVLSSKRDDFYAIATKQGELEKLYTRNQLILLHRGFLSSDDMPNYTILQSTAMQSTFSWKCQNCSTYRCPCKIFQRSCYSKCHKGKACRNKNLVPLKE